MRYVALSLLIATSLASCQTTKIDAAISKLNASISNYCAVLQESGAIVQSVDNKPLLGKINGGISAYCDPSHPVNDTASALLALAKIYKAVHDAGVTPTIPVASN